MPRRPLACDYALYQGDDLIMIGSRQELAAYLQVTERTVYYYSTEAYRRKLQDHQDRGRRRLVVALR